MHSGRWQLAEIDALEAVALSPPGFAMSGYASSILACLDALKGNAESCRARAQRTLRQAAVADEGVAITFAMDALAMLEQTLETISVRSTLPRERRGGGPPGLRNPLITSTWVGIVETGVLVGEHDVARKHQELLESAAAALDPPSLYAPSHTGRPACERRRLSGCVRGGARMARTGRPSLRLRPYAACLRRAPAARPTPRRGAAPPARGSRTVRRDRQCSMGGACPAGAASDGRDDAPEGRVEPRPPDAAGVAGRPTRR